jgi:purine-nucleoside phosphorylase
VSGVTLERVERSAEFLRARGIGVPRAAFVFGSGLSKVLPLESSNALTFAEIPEFPRGAVAGHDRVLEFGRAEGAPVLVLRGRVHGYEGVPLADATMPIRVAKALGAPWILLTNAAGAIRPSYEVGDLVFLTDHLNWMGDNPLLGPNDDRLGPRFPDMSRAYSTRLRAVAEAAARAAGIATRRGVYAAVSGPHYETPAELRMLRLAGADLVGMSTVPEAIVARHSGMRVLGISGISNKANLDGDTETTHEEVLEAGRILVPRLEAVVRGFLQRLG